MKIEPAAALRGHIAVPGDKSISHRAVLLGAIGEGETSVRGFGRSGDTEATIAAVRALGVTVHEDEVDALRVEGTGLRGLEDRVEALDGRLRVESEPGRGTRIVAAIPLAEVRVPVPHDAG